MGYPDHLCGALRSALAVHGVATTADPRELRAPGSREAFVIVTTESRATRRGLGGWREHAAHQANADRITEMVVDAAATVPGVRVLILCDGSGAPSSSAAIRATRQLGRRLAYECAMNATSIRSTTYVVIDDATPATTAIDAAVTWYLTHQRCGAGPAGSEKN
ncbi:hypothetical protein [Williamsia sp.]|uniref:hypothetical protein n=1 Tax=Williamsia sp. TaxID=1872085 RepID=UPI002F93FC27